MQKTIQCLANEFWWGGAIGDGVQMPFGTKSFTRDLCDWFLNNQASPSLLSNRGRMIYSREPFAFTFADGTLTLTGEGPFELMQAGNTLQTAHQKMVNTYYLPDHKMPNEKMFSCVQYNTWIQMQYEPTQEKVLQYAKNILRHGYQPGVLMIDDCWNKDYGVWEFEASRFPQPKKMVEELHAMGFSVMLWSCPFLSPDSFVFRAAEQEGLLVKNQEGETLITHWWNGYSAVLDLTNPRAVAWYQAQNQRLMDEIGIDGFKMDAGDPEFYPQTSVFYEKRHRAWQANLWAEISRSYSFNEIRGCYAQECKGIAQRIRDKLHSWGEEGLGALVPNALAMSLCGYSFLCPDMVGGGMAPDFNQDGFQLDQELFVRYAQCSALMPMIQFSLAPWEVLDEEHATLCREAIHLREKFLPQILALAENSRLTGEPIARPLCYDYPQEGYETVTDQFLLGKNILVAPVLKKGAVEKTVYFPGGKWKAEDGTLFLGPVCQTVPAPMHVLPVFTKVE